MGPVRPGPARLLGLAGLVLLRAGAGADLEVRTPSGLTPLMQAALRCRTRVDVRRPGSCGPPARWDTMVTEVLRKHAAAR
jgi:hypothetical protein